MHTVWSSELDTLLMLYGVKFTSYRIKSVSNSLDQTVGMKYFGFIDVFSTVLLRSTKFY